MVSSTSTQLHQTSSTKSFVISRQQKPKPKMSITQTYYLAHTARRKLSKEASRADHNLRVLVSHANLLDSLMLDLSNAEREQERWFNQTVSTANKASHEKHIQWADSIVEEPEEDWEAEEISDDSDSDSDLSDDDTYYEDSSIYTASMTPLRRTTPPVIITQQELSSSDSEEDDEEDKEGLALTRSAPHSPPELLEDLSDDSEEDVAPPSPPQPTFNIFSPSEHPSKKAGLTFTAAESSPFNDDYLSQHEAGTMIEAY